MSSEIVTKEALRKKHKELTKTIFVHNIITSEIKTISVQLKENVRSVKNKIEKEFHFESGYLDDYKLRISLEGRRESKLLAQDSMTLEEYHVKNNSTIVFGKEKNIGGNINIKLIYL